MFARMSACRWAAALAAVLFVSVLAEAQPPGKGDKKEAMKEKRGKGDGKDQTEVLGPVSDEHLESDEVHGNLASPHPRREWFRCIDGWADRNRHNVKRRSTPKRRSTKEQKKLPF